MKQIKSPSVRRGVPLLLALSMLLTSCGRGASASTMRLRKTEGTVNVSNSESMNIRTSTMAVGIRGACGWVTQDAAIAEQVPISKAGT